MKTFNKYCALFLVSLIFMFPKDFSAQKISEDVILKTAKNFFSEKLDFLKPGLQKQASIDIKKIFEINSINTDSYLGTVVKLSPKGFVILSNNRSLSPIIAYSFHNDWNNDTSSTNTLLQILKFDLSNRLEHLDEIPVEIQEKNKNLWDYYQAGNNSNDYQQDFRQWPKVGTTTTGGWIETTWHQTEPYNQFCPIDPNTNERSVIGCGALAVAQIVNYHKYFNNKRFSDEDKYYSENSTISIDADSSAFDFPSFNELNRRLDTLQFKYDNNLPLNDRDYAALCFACGIMTNNEYSSIETPTVSSELHKAFSIDMLYSSADISSVTDDFYSILIDNMKNGLPAELSFWSAIGGHAAVCDGYNNDDFYHINFGWGANSPTTITDCWYDLSEELPYKFSIFNAIINIKPGIEENTFLTVHDSLIKFEPSLVNTSSEAKVCKLRNDGNTVITIEEIVVPNNFSASLDGTNYYNSISQFTINPKSEIPLYLICMPDSIGRFDGKMEITITSRKLKRYKLIKLLGYGGPENGTLITDEFISGIWNTSVSPYLVIDNVSVEPGKNLTLMPGTEVKLLNNCDFFIGENAQFIAKGTETDSIYFTSLNPLNGCNGLIFEDSGDDDTLAFCVFTIMGTELIDGGAIHTNLTNITIRDSRFYNNRGRNGGAIFVRDSSPNISSSKFKENNAYFGGSLYLIGSNSKIENSIFELNIAGSGGAIYMRDSSPLLYQLNITNNSANGFGGAMYMRSSSPTCQYLEINQNTSDDLGGAIYLIESTPKISFSNFFNNTALSSGGIFYSSNSEFSINNCIWDSNIAQNEGSIFSSSKSSISFNNITAVNHLGNLFADLISINNSNTILIKNSIIWNKNHTTSNQQVNRNINKISETMILTDTVKFYYNNFDSMFFQEINEGNSNVVVVGEEFNISSDPQFANFEEKDFRLLETSPCIDAGDPNDDVGNEPFPHGYRVNLGVYGATEDAALTTDSSITASPDPINFGEFSSVFTKKIILYIKNGTLYDVEIFNVSLKDSTYFSLSESPFIDNNLLPSGSIDSITIQFTPPDIGEGIFDTEIIIRTNSSTKSIPIFARLYEGIHIGGNISGILTREEGPYTVDEDLIITESLVIEPGVHLRFDGDCGINVEANGELIAKGNKSDSIKFSARDPILGWNGIKIENSEDDDTLDFCIIKDVINDYLTYRAGLWVIASNTLIRNCHFIGNQGYACKLGDSPGMQYPVNQQIVISNCRFEQNSGGIDVWYSSVIIENTVFFNNIGRCIGFYSSDVFKNKLKLINVTASENYYSYSLFYFSYYMPDNDSSHVDIINSILDKNLSESGNIIRTNSANILVEYSNIDTTSENWFDDRTLSGRTVGKLIWGEGNISTNPMFVDSEYGDFTLLEDSPCIDAGNSNDIYNDIEDPFNSGYALWPAMGTIRNDMGAYGGGTYDYTTSIEDSDGNNEIPTSYSLSQNYPNPFNPSTTIKYSIPVVDAYYATTTKVQLKIYDILGREVAIFVNEKQKPGYYEVIWNAINQSSGVYFYRLIATPDGGQSGNYVETKKMVILK